MTKTDKKLLNESVYSNRYNLVINKLFLKHVL